MRHRLKNLYPIGVLACALGLSGPAIAIVACQGTITNVGMEPNGEAYAIFGYGNLRICSLRDTVVVDRGSGGGGPTNLVPAQYQAFVALLTTAKAQGKQLVVNVDQSTCTFTSGAYPNPYPYFFNFLP